MALDIAKHKSALLKILKSIYIDPTISYLLGFKGGTAAALFYGLDRFSVDLDFDLLESDKEDYVFEQVKKILESYGTLKEAIKKRFNLFFLLSYDKKDVNAQNVKVEINRRALNAKYNIESALGISMKVMVQQDMAAYKLCAMYERISRTSRDIYDVQFFFAHNWLVNKEIIEGRMGMSYKEFLKKSIGVMEKFENRNILAGLGELLTQSQKDWVKTKLKDETIFLLKLALENA